MSSVDVHFLGSGDAFGSGGRMQACILLRGAGEPLLLDCGATSLVAMKRAGVDPNEIGFVALSHLHGDHFGGLPFLLLDGQFNRRTMPLVVAGPPGVRARVHAAMEALYPGSSTVERKFAVEFIELGERETIQLAGWAVTPFGVVHGSGAPPFAIRAETDGVTISYSGDTEWTDALIDAANGADLFICESYGAAKKMRFHIDFETLRANRHRIACLRVVLTHMGPETLAAETPGFERADDGLVLRVNPRARPAPRA